MERNISLSEGQPWDGELDLSITRPKTLPGAPRMTDLTDIKAAPAAMSCEAPGLPDPDLVYANYLKKCHRRGVTPVSRDHARDLMGNWFDVLGRVMTEN